MSESPVHASEDASGKRRPKEEDLDAILDLIWDNKSLRQACEKLGLHVPSTSDWLHADEGRREQYMRAREGRAEAMAEDAGLVTRAAALGLLVNNTKVDASGARAYADFVKWRTGQMAPKMAPRMRIDHHFADMTDEELDREIERMRAGDDGHSQS